MLQERNPGLAAVFSFLFSGLGQIYNGQILKGLLIIFLSFLSILVFLAGSLLIGFSILSKEIFFRIPLTGLALFFSGLIAIAILGAYSIFDAYRFTSKK